MSHLENLSSLLIGGTDADFECEAEGVGVIRRSND
jgi:hypothetical protein